MSFVIHLIVLALLALWLRRETKPALARLFGFWGAGLVLQRIVPAVVSLQLLRNGDMAQHRGLAFFLALTECAGAVLLARSLIGLALWERPPSRKLQVFRWLFFGGLLMQGLFPKVPWLWTFFTIPYLWSFRWRRSISARWLILLTVGGVVSVALLTVTYGRNPGDWGKLFPGLAALPGLIFICALTYALVAMPAAASRIHLSIRRIGPRLIGSHLMAGVVPVCLAGLFLLLSAALFLATYRGTLALRLLHQESAVACGEIHQALAGPAGIPHDPFGDMPNQVVLLRRDHEPSQVLEGSLSIPADSLLARNDSSTQVPLLWDGRTLYLRARDEEEQGGHRLRVEALAPVDSVRMRRITEILGVPAWVNPSVAVQSTGGGIQIGGTQDSLETKGGEEKETGDAIGPAGSHRRGLPGGTVVTCLRWSGGRFSRGMIPISSYAVFGEQILSLVRAGKENVLATVVLIALSFLAVLFLGALFVATSMVLDMGHSVTRAVRALTGATTALREGNLAHRIQVEGQDELWSVAASFNEMAEGLEKMRTMERETQRLEEELRLARVIQDRLLPSAPPVMEHAELAGISLPARQVGGDYYDYLLLDGGHLGLAVADVSGKGAPAAILMSTFRASLRSQDLSRLGPAEVLARINRFIHSSIDPGRFITAFLGLLDPVTGEFRYANAGHDAPIVIRPDGTQGELSGGGLILGMLPQILYEEASVILEPGSLVAIFTDGVTEARDPNDGFYGEERLAGVLKARRGEACVDLLRHVVDSIQSYAGSAEQSDDITLVLLRRR